MHPDAVDDLSSTAIFKLDKDDSVHELDRQMKLVQPINKGSLHGKPSEMSQERRILRASLDYFNSCAEYAHSLVTESQPKRRQGPPSSALKYN